MRSRTTLISQDPSVDLMELDSVSKLFLENDVAALEEITFSVQKGDFLAIVGPSGAGKSTLLNILGLLDSPSSGVYTVFGIKASELSEQERNRLRAEAFGFVFQASYVLGDESVLSNAAMGLRIQGIPMGERSRLARRAVERVGLSKRASSRAKVLSGGERQRLAIARAIATNPRIILADEPTGNLDSANSQKVISYLQELHLAGATIVVITHDPEVAAAASRQVRILDGRIEQQRSKIAGQKTLTPGSSDAPRTEIVAQRRQNRWGSLLDDLAEAVSALSTRAIRTVLLTVAFAIGIGGLVASVGLSESAAAQVSSRLTAAALDEVSVNLPNDSRFQEPGNALLNDYMAGLQDLPHVTNVGFIVSTSAVNAKVTRLRSTDQEPERAIGLSAASPSFFELSEIKAVPENSPKLLGIKSTGPVALLSVKAAESLDVYSSSKTGPGAGTSIWINGHLTQIVGFFEPNDRVPELDSYAIVSPDVLTGIEQLQYKLVVRTDPGFPAVIAKAAPLVVTPTDPGSVTVETVADLRELRIGVANDLGVMVAVLSSVLLALATISAATAMYLSVQSRTSEIALRRAIGSSRGLIGRLFITEGFLIGLAGGVLGGALGTGAILVIANAQGWIAVLPSNLPLIGLASGVITGLISSLYPSWVASRQNPASAIRG